jgi:hypothetical protein
MPDRSVSLDGFGGCAAKTIQGDDAAHATQKRCAATYVTVQREYSMQRCDLGMEGVAHITNAHDMRRVERIFLDLAA